MKERPKPGYRLLLSDEQVLALKRLALDRNIPMQTLCRNAVLALLDHAAAQCADPTSNIKQLPSPAEDSDKEPLLRLSKRNDTLAIFLRELAKMADSDPRWGGHR